MTVMVWDQIADRRYETGVERGVLFPLSGPAVPWNGLVSVSETLSREVKSYYIDGMKFLDHVIPGAYQAKLQAFTYPDVLDGIQGVAEYVPGVNVHDQRFGMFHLSYRTRVGNPLEGLDHGYKLHLLYNLTAIPSDTTFNTVSDNAVPTTFEWTLNGVQTVMWGIRPTNHLSFDSREVDPDILAYVEGLVYGTPTTEPVMPDLVTLLTTIDGM